MKLGQTIAEIRKKNELTQEEFAKEFSVTRQTVSNWENEKSYPDLLTLIKISDTYGYSLDSMLKEDPDMTEAMNRSIQLGNEARERQKKSFYVGLIGSIACIVMLIFTIVDGRSALAMICWLLCTLINMSSLAGGIQAHRQTQSNIKPLEAGDMETIKQLIQRDMNTEAIKLVRKATGLGLVEAKTLVDEIKNGDKE